VAITSRTDRNMGHGGTLWNMTNVQYERYARAVPYSRQYEDMSPNDHHIVKHKTWLVCFGLLETWDIMEYNGI